MSTKTGVIVIEGHVQGLSNTRELGKRGIPVWVIDTGNCVAKYSRYCQKFVQCPAFNSDALADFLIDLAKTNNLEGWMLLPSNDHAVYTISRNHHRLSNYFKLITGKTEQLDLIYDKVNLLELALKAKVDFPFYQSKSSLEELDLNAFEYPVITKGRVGLDFHKKLKTKVIISTSALELKKNLIDLSTKFPIEKTFTQNIIPFDKGNKTISVGCFASEGELVTCWMGVKKREHPLTFGTATLAESIYNKELVEPTKNILKALNYSGICEIEFLFDPRDKTYNLIEINARTWLWVGLAAECGVPLVWLAYQKANGLKMEIPNHYEKNVVWFNPFTNIVFTLKGLLNGKVKWQEIQENFGKKKVNALFIKGDFIPGWMYFVLLLKFMKTR
jgi:D-aspartate ligase